MKRKLTPARASRVGYPTLELARRILLASVLACGAAHADNSIPKPPHPEGDRAVRTGGKPMPPHPPLPGGPMVVHPPPPPGVPPQVQPPKKVENKK
jgi:hypothetical protein